MPLAYPVMGNKRQVFVSLHHRDSLSLFLSLSARIGNDLAMQRTIGGFSFLPKIPKHQTAMLSTLAMDLSDPVNRSNRNEGSNWHFREKLNVDPTQSGQLIGIVMVGKVPHEATDDAQICGLLKAIPLPRRGLVPKQNCVTCTKAAICKLRENGFVKGSDLDRVMDEMLVFADQRIYRTKSTPNRLTYTRRLV